MAAIESISKDALLRAISEIPSERLTFSLLFEHMLRLFKVDGKSQKAKPIGKISGGRGLKKFDYEAYRRKILQTSPWTEAEVTAVEDARNTLNKWTVKEW